VIDTLKYLLNDELRELNLTNLDEKTSSYISARLEGKIRRNCKPENLHLITTGYDKMTNEELIKFFEMYDICEYVGTEEEMDYIMSRIGYYLGERPWYIEY